jgi:hypothetical protein
MSSSPFSLSSFGFLGDMGLIFYAGETNNVIVVQMMEDT